MNDECGMMNEEQSPTRNTSCAGPQSKIQNRKSNIVLPRRPRLLWLPVVVWAAIIVAATSVPGHKLPPSPFRYTDIATHVFLYGVLGFLLHRAIRLGTRFGALRWAWLVAFAAVQAYGILDEIHQLWIPNRFCSLGDMLADGVGALLGMWVYSVWLGRARWRSR